MIVSGIRPTGNIHLGNYLGAIKEWKKYPNGVYFVADLHGLHPRDVVINTHIQLEKLGINKVKIESNYKKEILSLFHELSFYANCGQLKRMTQFKDKSKTENPSLSLFAYPVLMAADIAYFEGTKILVGNDQLQHIEFARDLLAKAGYPIPEPIIGEYPRIMSLKDGTKKMSKSELDDYTRINVNDSPDLIRDKIMKAKSANDFNENTPEMINLKTIYKAVGGNASYFPKMKNFKEELAELIIKEFAV